MTDRSWLIDDTAPPIDDAALARRVLTRLPLRHVRRAMIAFNEAPNSYALAGPTLDADPPRCVGCFVSCLAGLGRVSSRSRQALCGYAAHWDRALARWIGWVMIETLSNTFEEHPGWLYRECLREIATRARRPAPAREESVPWGA